jgi:type II secretory pathway pseudopilin PulG
MKSIAGKLHRVKGESGFTLVELLVVLVLSMIMLGAMIALGTMAFDLFKVNRNLQALNDTSRTMQSSMSRQIKETLHLDNAACDVNQLTFYADLTGTCANTADVNNYTSAYKVRYYYDSGAKTVKVDLTPPGGSVETAKAIGSNVTALRFYYFLPNTPPGPTEDQTSPTTSTYKGSDKNYDVGMIRIVFTLSKGKTTRTYYQDVSLRTLGRPKSS